jgi:hypothetical protein
MNRLANFDCYVQDSRMKTLKEATINDATIKIEDREKDSPENRYIVVWRSKDDENRYSARSLEDAEEYYEYRYRLAEQRRI